MELQEVVEQTLAELGMDLTDDNEDDFLVPTVEDTAGPEPEEEGEVPEESETDSVEEDSDQNAEPAEIRAIDISEDAFLRLPDGTEVPAKDAILFQKDYTKKTQQVAEERRNLEIDRAAFEKVRREVEDTYAQMREWYDQRVANRPGWVQEIISEAEDPTATLAKAIYELAQSGRLDPDFVETFGLESGEIAEKAKASTRDDEIAELRRKVELRERAEYEQNQIRQQAAVYQQQWENVKNSHGLKFDSQEAELIAKQELYGFALQNNILSSLENAYDIMIVRTGKFNQTADTEPVKSDPEVVAKKRASRAVTPKSASPAGGQKARPSNVRSAAVQSLEEYLTRA